MRIPFTLATDPERREALYADIEEMSSPSASYYLRVAIATTIATFGLLANSTAVVIGAMLVAPLMGPIFGVALGLSAGDRHLLRLAATSEVLGALLAFVIALIAGLVPLQLGLGSEILSRTEPTLYDLVVALASGLAGAYALADERLSASLPGVAISTALVPPIAASGLCFAAGQYSQALGSFLLFFANFVAIQISSAAVFIASGLPTTRIAASLDRNTLVRRFGISLAALVLVGIFMTRTLVKLVEYRRMHSAIATELSLQVRRSTGAALRDFTLEPGRDAVEVVATALTPQEFSPEQIGTFEQVLKTRVDPRIHLVVRSLISRDFDRSGPVYIPRQSLEKAEAVSRETALLRTVTEFLSQRLREIPGAGLADLRREGEGEPIRLVALVRSPNAIDPEQVAAMQQALSTNLGRPASLIVRSVLTRDADAARFIYDPPDERSAPSSEQLERRRRIETLLRQELSARPGGSLDEVLESSDGGRELVVARTRSISPVLPTEVDRIQATLRREISPQIELMIRYELGGTVSPAGTFAPEPGEPLRVPRAFETQEFRERLRFASGSSRVPDEAVPLLAAAARDLADLPASQRVVVEGFCDGRGRADRNVELALRRARAVRAVLMAHGVPADRILLKGWGSGRPVAPETTARGRAQNRRVELRIEDL